MVRLVVVYRPPKGAINDFIDDFASFLEDVIHTHGRLIIVGDFNIHIDNPANNDTARFTDFLDSMGLTQRVIGPTHSKGHTLDLIITRTDDPCVTNIESDWLLPSDHASLHFSTAFTRPRPLKFTRASRKLSNINITVLQEKITSSLQSAFSETGFSPTVLVNAYNSALTSVIDEVAPVIHKEFVDKARAPWFTEELIHLRQNLRRLERQWRKSGLVVHEQIFKSARSVYTTELRDLHASYYRHRIEGADTKGLFRIIDNMTGTKRALSSIKPDMDSTSLPDIFADFSMLKLLRFERICPLFNRQTLYQM